MAINSLETWNPPGRSNSAAPDAHRDAHQQPKIVLHNTWLEGRRPRSVSHVERHATPCQNHHSKFRDPNSQTISTTVRHRRSNHLPRSRGLGESFSYKL